MVIATREGMVLTVGAREAAKHPSVPRRAPPPPATENDLTPNVNSGKMEKCILEGYVSTQPRFLMLIMTYTG